MQTEVTHVAGDETFASHAIRWALSFCTRVPMPPGTRITSRSGWSSMVWMIGKPDPVRGEIVKAFVILAPGYEGSLELTKEIQDYVKGITAPYKYPREIEYVAELPKTISGKIRRVELRDRS